jgi:glycosyltransferase involved in cell wall biosynthesis
MAKITAIIHTDNSAKTLGRLLESLRPANEVLVVDHSSEDDSVKIARHHGAIVKEGLPGVEAGAYVMDASHDWILCLRPDESLSEGLEAALLGWKEHEHEKELGFAFPIREQKDGQWHTLPAEMRLVNRRRLNWKTALPPNRTDVPRLDGDLLRIE